MKVPKLRLGHLDHSVYEKGRFRGGVMMKVPKL
jgi:hypothetical protein